MDASLIIYKAPRELSCKLKKQLQLTTLIIIKLAIFSLNTMLPQNIVKISISIVVPANYIQDIIASEIYPCLEILS